MQIATAVRHLLGTIHLPAVSVIARRKRNMITRSTCGEEGRATDQRRVQSDRRGKPDTDEHAKRKPQLEDNWNSKDTRNTNRTTPVK
jgi:hypothetical protein